MKRIVRLGVMVVLASMLALHANADDDVKVTFAEFGNVVGEGRFDCDLLPELAEKLDSSLVGNVKEAFLDVREEAGKLTADDRGSLGFDGLAGALERFRVALGGATEEGGISPELMDDCIKFSDTLGSMVDDSLGLADLPQGKFSRGVESFFKKLSLEKTRAGQIAINNPVAVVSGAAGILTVFVLGGGAAVVYKLSEKGGGLGIQSESKRTNALEKHADNAGSLDLGSLEKSSWFIKFASAFEKGKDEKDEDAKKRYVEGLEKFPGHVLSEAEHLLNPDKNNGHKTAIDALKASIDIFKNKDKDNRSSEFKATIPLSEKVFEIFEHYKNATSDIEILKFLSGNHTFAELKIVFGIDKRGLRHFPISDDDKEVVASDIKKAGDFLAHKGGVSYERSDLVVTYLKFVDFLVANNSEEFKKAVATIDKKRIDAVGVETTKLNTANTELVKVRGELTGKKSELSDVADDLESVKKSLFESLTARVERGNMTEKDAYARLDSVMKNKEDVDSLKIVLAGFFGVVNCLDSNTNATEEEQKKAREDAEEIKREELKKAEKTAGN